MKILFCTNVYDVVENGPVKFARLLLQINELYPSHELQILTEDTDGRTPAVHKVRMKTAWKRSFLSQFIRMIQYHRRAMRLRKKFKFDVLVYNNALVGLYSTFRFSNTVGMINDYAHVGSTILPLRISRKWLKSRALGWAERKMARRAQRIIVNSDFLKKLVVEKYRIPGEKVIRLYKGVDLPPINRNSRSIDLNESIKILFVKNDYMRGGLDVLRHALESLPYRFELTIVGTAAQAEGHIRALFGSSMNIEIIILGIRSQAEITALLSNTDVFSVPSLREALGVANLEAMAAGVPVVSTNAGGLPEVLDDGNAGWMTPPDDPSALALALRECFENEDIRQQKILKGYEHVKKFSKTILLKNFLAALAGEYEK